MQEQIKTIAEQINYRELSLMGFKFVYDDKNLSLDLIKGSKHLVIKLNEALDIYEIRKIRIRNFEIVQDLKSTAYCDELQNIIEIWFNVSYIQKYEWG